MLHEDPTPWRTDRLAVGDGHLLHVQQSGNPGGPPALVLHGGPGSGCAPLLRRFFDPGRWRIVCIDQRGAGLSTPRGATVANDTAALLADLRRLRAALGIARWVVVGGSWGATLALLHALDDPQAVTALLLRATFLARAEDIDAFFAAHDGLPALAGWRGFPDAPASAQRELALAWWRREQRLARGANDAAAPEAAPPEGEALAALIDRYRVQAHYLRNGCWIDAPPLLERAAALPRVPTLLLHGAADRICPPDGARALAARLPHATLRIVPGAGHDPAHPALAAAMVDALAHYAGNAAWPQPAPACAAR